MTTLTTLTSLETPHLFLREMRDDDAHDLSLFMTQPRYQRFIAHVLKDKNEVEAFVRRHVLAQADHKRRVFHLVAEEKLSGEAVGDSFLIEHGPGSFEIGWGLHPALWRMGFGSEISRATIATGFERLKAKEIWCKVMRPNTASQRLAVKLGLLPGKTIMDFKVGQGRTEIVDHFSIDVDRYFDQPY
jgi:[ribosomal protein S5]-alanine N-acetyltransferase